MAFVPGGTFIMGSGDEQGGTLAHERTTPDFSIDVTEVTAAAYDVCLLAGACTPTESSELGANSGQSEYSHYPVNYVTLDQAEAYCAWMGKRLPTETEWEYAAGARQGLEYPWGSMPAAACLPGLIPDPEALDSDYDHGCAVGQFPSNDNGVEDVGGGVYEYTSTPYCPYSDTTSTGYIDCNTELVALRGGAFTSSGKELARVSFRQSAPRDFAGANTGFRCARDAERD